MTRDQPERARSTWKPRRSRDLPAMRDLQISSLRSDRYHVITAQALEHGSSSYFMPKIVGLYDELGRSTDGLHQLVQARLLCQAEAARLAAPTPIWHATADMTDLALSLVKTPPSEPARAERLPSETGFIVFDKPIGGTTASIHDLTRGLWDQARHDLTITTPVVAAAWSTWKATDDGPDVQWYRRSPFGVSLPVDDDFDGVWVNFYTAVRDLYGQLDDDEPLWTDPTGVIITAADVYEAHKHGVTPELEMHADIVLRWGARLPAARASDTREHWLNVLYTSWQLLSQKSTRTRAALVQTEQLPARYSQKKGDSGVRIVRVHPDYGPTADEQARDHAASSGRRTGTPEYRWRVPAHRRSVCHNPAGHHLDPDECTRTTHIDVIVARHINGPIGKPLRIQSRVRKWDSQPGNGSAT